MTALTVAPVDRPLTKASEDLFSRAALAEAFAKQVLSVPKGESSVFGVAGAWGAGKSSFVNFVAASLPADVTVLHFNPWFFSTTDGLVQSFLTELATSLKLGGRGRAKEVGEHLQRYAKLLAPVKLIPVVGIGAGAVLDSAETVGGFLTDRFASLPLHDQRKKVDEALIDQGRLLIVFDDVDRLTDEEIRSIMRLVRLVADFANVTYLLVFDRNRVESALDAGHGDGRAYLEKIFQFVLDLPPPRRSALKTFLVNGINAAAAGATTGPVYSNFSSIFNDVIFPLVNTPRDVRRYCSGLPLLLATIGSEVAFGDAICIEALRVFRPDLFAWLAQNRALLTMPPDSDSPKAAPAMPKTDLDLAALVRNLFPMAQRFFENQHYGGDFLATWRKERRVAHPQILDFLLERTWPSDVAPVSVVADLFGELAQPVPFAAHLAAITDEQLESVLESLLDYRGEFSVEHLQSVPVLTGLLPRLREGKRDYYDEGAEMRLSRVILRLLRTLRGRSDGLAQYRAIVAAIPSLNEKQLLADFLSYEQDEHRILKKADAERAAADFFGDVLSAGDDAFLNPSRVSKTFFWALRHARAGDGKDIPRVLDTFSPPSRFLRLLQGSLSTAFIIGIESGSQTSSISLPWHVFEETYGHDRLRELVQRAVDGAPATLDSATKMTIEFATKWLESKPDDEFLAKALDQ